MLDKLLWQTSAMRKIVAALCLAVAVLQTSATAQQAPVDAAALAKTAVEHLAKGEFDDVVAKFDAKMQAGMSLDLLKSTWATLQMQAGPFKEQRDVRVQQSGPYRIAIVACAFERTVLDLQFAFDAEAKIAGLVVKPHAAPWSAPSYADVSKFSETDITVGVPEWPLPATLSMPNGPGPFPAVVLVHGTGPVDRDESVGANKTFKDLAFGLASRGIAVLRYDKRKKVFGAKLATIKNHTVKDETIDDALTAVAVLRKTAKIDPAKIIVIGHSLGGMLMPRIGAADPALAGLVSMAGLASDFQLTVARQHRYLFGLDGQITPDEQTQIDAVDAAAKSIAALTAADADGPKIISGEPASYWLDLRGYDPPALAKTLKQPLLILQGERDYQVTMTDDFVRWKAALDGKSTATFHTYPALNHLFTPGVGKSGPAEYDVASHVPEQVIGDIAAWIAALASSR